MTKRSWFTIIILSVLFSLVSLFISFFKQGEIITNYINISFIIGLLFLLIFSINLIIISGFFDLFFKGWKKLLFNEDSYTVSTHLNMNKEDNIDKHDKENKLLRKKAKYQLFLFIPLIIGIILLFQSTLFLTLIK